MLSSGQFYFGVAFAAAALLFLYRIYFHKSPVGPMDPARRNIVDVVCALCAGASGAFIAGAYVDVQVQAHGSRGVYQLAGGFVLFVLTLLVLRLTGPAASPQSAPVPSRAPAPPSASVSIGTKSPFGQVAETLAELAKATVDLSAFRPEELRVIPSSMELPCATLTQAKSSLQRLGKLVPPGSVRPYRVELDEAKQHFTLVPEP